MGALVNALAGTPLDTGIDAQDLSKLSTFWCALVSTANAVAHLSPQHVEVLCSHAAPALQCMLD